MKVLWCTAIGLFFSLAACKKPGGREYTVPAKIQFEIIGKDGTSLIHSIKDSVVVTYIMNSVAYTHQLHTYKVQVSANDTTLVSKYNGFVISDWDPATNQGYISSPSGGGVRNFNVFLNGVSIGTLYWDYWGYLSLGSPPPASSEKVTLNSHPVKWDSLTGSFSDGHHIVENADSPGEFVYVLQE